MGGYKNTSIDQLIWDESFRKWVESPTDELDVKWKQWLSDHPGQQPVVDQAREIVLSLKIRGDELSDQDLDALIQRTLGGARQSSRVQPRSFRIRFPVYAQRYAAAVVFLVAIGGWFFLFGPALREQQLGPGSEQAMVTRENHSPEPMEMHLPDGSLVRLEPASKITYARAFGEKLRNVELTGEAFFDVERDEERPFLVSTGDLITKVLGTSFSVRAFPDAGESTVVVRSGRVAVFPSAPLSSASTPDSTILTPNQQMVFSRRARSWEKSLVDTPEPLPEPAQTVSFVYDESPVATAFRDIEKVYGVEIVFDEKQYQCPVTAVLAGLTMHEQIRVLCKAVGARFSYTGGVIKIEGSACIK